MNRERFEEIRAIIDSRDFTVGSDVELVQAATDLFDYAEEIRTKMHAAKADSLWEASFMFHGLTGYSGQAVQSKLRTMAGDYGKKAPDAS